MKLKQQIFPHCYQSSASKIKVRRKMQENVAKLYPTPETSAKVLNCAYSLRIYRALLLTIT